MVFRGVKEFNIEATELSISVIARANKNAGKKVPKLPEIAIHFHSFFVNGFNLWKPIKKIKIPEIKIRNAPN